MDILPHGQAGLRFSGSGIHEQHLPAQEGEDCVCVVLGEKQHVGSPNRLLGCLLAECVHFPAEVNGDFGLRGRWIGSQFGAVVDVEVPAALFRGIRLVRDPHFIGVGRRGIERVQADTRTHEEGHRKDQSCPPSCPKNPALVHGEPPCGERIQFVAGVVRQRMLWSDEGRS